VATDGNERVGGRYELVRRIARGGGGTVWQAEDAVLGRTVAVKVVEIPPELASAERERARSRVLQEARAAARLHHPSAVVVHDVLDDEDHLHLVMELVSDPTLHERVAQHGPLPEDEVAAAGLALVDVLAVAHERGIVHRDVKPSNVFVLDDGGVKLADFGIAALTGETSLTRTGTALGSPSYLAPEQAQGEQASPAADVWGLGACLYFAVEGEPPFDRGNAIATVNAVVHEPARAFQRADAMRPLLTALLAKDPRRRPTLDEVAEELRTIAGTPVPRPAPPQEGGTTQALPVQDAGPVPDAPDAQAGAADAAPHAGDAPRDDGDPDDGHQRRRSLAILAAVVALAVLTVAAVVLSDAGPLDEAADDPPLADAPAEDTAEPAEDDPVDDEPADDEPADDEPAEPDDTAATDDPAGDDGSDGGTEPEAADGGDATTTGEDGRLEIVEADVPDDWQVVEGATYRVAIPPGWQERDGAGNLTDYVDPDTGAYLRVDWTDEPAGDPVADWEANESGFAQRQDDYERIRLEPATYRGRDAAMWEYSYAAGGARLRALNLNLLAGDRAYALNLQSPADDWDEVGALFPAIAGGFEPDG
jgi:eukaryotic-like serine/threonine-protein kinase